MALKSVLHRSVIQKVLSSVKSTASSQSLSGLDSPDSLDEVIRRYMKRQMQRLCLHGCHYPDRLFVMFLSLPPFFQRHLAVPVTQRRRVQTLRRTTDRYRTHRSSDVPRGAYRRFDASHGQLSKTPVKSRSSCLPPAYFSSIRPRPLCFPKEQANNFSAGEAGRLLADSSVFPGCDSRLIRLVKSHRDTEPLLIQTTQLRSTHLKQINVPPSGNIPPVNTSKKTPINRHKEGSNRNQGTVALVIFCGGKDMLSLDWLPFLSHFFHYAVKDRAGRTDVNKGHTKKTKWLPIKPLVPLPPSLFRSNSKTGRPTSHGGSPTTTAPESYLDSDLTPTESESVCESSLTDGTTTPPPSGHAGLKSHLHLNGRAIQCGLRSAFLLLEYPGSGCCCGPPSVISIVDAAIKVKKQTRLIHHDSLPVCECGCRTINSTSRSFSD